MDSDTELDMKKQRRSIHTAGSVNSSSYSFCGLSTKSSNTSQSLMSELDSQKLSRIKRYADESGDIRFKSKSKENSSAESIDSASKTKNVLEAETINLREEVISQCLNILKNLYKSIYALCWIARVPCDAPPHGRRFTSQYDNYLDGDPNGLTAEDVLEKIQSEEILYYFGKITNQTDKMLNVFRDIIDEFLVFDLNTDGSERYAYYALDLTREPAEKIIMKECVKHGRKANSLEGYFEMIETSSIAYFLSKKFNSAAKQDDNKKVKLVKFLKPQALRHKDDSGTQCYTIEPNLLDKYHAHYTYEYTKGYLVVYDLQGIKLEDKFLLTDPAIHCEDRLRFGKTNLEKRGIEQCFLANHECGNVCEKLGLPKITKTF
ncbi:kinase-like domain-containing protein [Glomus cerebriforme]|uniref:Kinase-like domain-containing protein n=1 Tax=Glomus cerebriforme TaxID=658196 RepID=A0A397T7T8_9GLOM|nr:kinase-like domain-containing protein [Glomus cerebriforme]